MIPEVTNSHELEKLAAMLESSGEYRILRRLRLAGATPPPVGATMRRGVIVDVETTGLDSATDEIIELAMLAFDYSTDGAFVASANTFDQLREPGQPIPPEVTRLTGITDEMVADQSIDCASVDAFIADAALVIAHNAAFDRRVCERLVPSFAAKPWACSIREVDWIFEGFESARLSSLAAGYGRFFDSHRALHDCEAALDVLSRPLPRTGRIALSALLESARRPKWRLRAVRPPFAVRERLKLRGYRWEAGKGGAQGAWCTETDQSSFPAECDFLRHEIYRQPAPSIDARLLTAYERYSLRSD
ncbi:3'-5' exonuclease [Bradyrhizobium sp. WSM471]|uniref:3'-5' exonuclease n=1 Tax=Bradyrhizobium sp. WSM471 TaxID=319017 RepID=UPI00024D1999|nr:MULTISPECIES: 3'-5' exonuclease [Bradyrhizobium]EHR00272.1 DNA polymerase III epsilon subunit-like 3'-5' exonuclease [Bradyrhizobium sp. WSM471]UFW42387.1 3'-5' exonuclease [Bradyrhizobium canariense]